MKEKFLVLLMGIIIAITPFTTSVSADEQGDNTTIQFTEQFVEIRTTASLIEPYCHVEDLKRGTFDVDASNPVWKAYTNEEMKGEEPNRIIMKKGDYWYAGYSIEFVDGTFELGSERTLNYNDLKNKKPIKQVHTYYALSSKATIKYLYESENGERELLYEEVKQGIHKQAWPNVLDYKGDKFYLNWDYVKDYNVLSPSFLSEPDAVDQMGPYSIYSGERITNVYLREPIIRVLFKDESGKIIREQVLVRDLHGKKFEYDAPEIEGYMIKGENHISATFDRDEYLQSITLTYVVDDKHPVDPVKPVEPVKPIDPAESVDPVKPVEAVKPTIKEMSQTKTLPNTGVNNRTVLIGIGIASVGLVALTLNLLSKQNKEETKKD